MVKVLLVDDHPVVRRGVREILSDEPDIDILETADGHECARLIQEGSINLVILDLDLPGKNGLDLLKEIKRKRPDLPVLILSIYPEEQFAVRVLKAGASGFVSKDAAPQELVKAVRKILGGGKHVSQRIAEFLLAQVGCESTSSPHERLSDREFQILCLLGAGKTVSSIAGELSLSVPTVSTYRARILQKMEMKTTAQLMHYAILNQLTTPK
jgi:two-component system, NarL family, invasion response regulator UvrY